MTSIFQLYICQKSVDKGSTHLVADHYSPRFPSFHSNQQKNQTLSIRDFSYNVVEVKKNLEIRSHTIYSLKILGLSLRVYCLYGKSVIVGCEKNNYISDKN